MGVDYVCQARDNSGLDPKMTYSRSNGSDFSLGETLVICTAEDASGNKNRCELTVTVEDKSGPTTSSCQKDIVLSTDIGENWATANWTEPTFTDNSGVAPFVSKNTDGPGGRYKYGNTTVTYTARDGSGNEGTCEFTITVTDSEKPVLTCPKNITIANDEGSDSAEVDYEVVVIDNVGKELAKMSSCVGVGAEPSTCDSGSKFKRGSTTCLLYTSPSPRD